MNRIEEIEAEITSLNRELKEIREACSHSPLALRYQFDDCYWSNYICTLCGKRWSVDRSVAGAKDSKRIEEEEKL
jgi:transposase-like protein